MSFKKKVRNVVDNNLLDQGSDFINQVKRRGQDFDFELENPFKEDKSDVDTHVLVGLVTFVLSFGLGFFVAKLFEKRAKDPDEILEDVKDAFKEEGPIDGSWIEMTKVPWKKHAYDTDVYYGGISRLEEGEMVQYEFIADAYTGSLMDIYKI